MKKSKLVKFLEKRQNAVKEGIKTFSVIQDPEILHRIRIDIKKTEALIRLLFAYNENQSIKKHFKPVIRIFKHAGSIRNANLNVQLIDIHKINAPSLQKQQELVSINLSAEFKKSSGYYKLIVDKAYSILIHYCCDLKKSYIKEEIQSVLNKFAGVDLRCIDAVQLHNVRKSIKYMLCLCKFSPHTSFISEQTILLLDKIQEAIGNWHDLYELKNLIGDKKLLTGSSNKHLTSLINQKLDEVIGFGLGEGGDFHHKC